MPDVGIEPTATGLKVLRSTTELIRLVQAVGFEPTKQYASDLKADPFDHSGKLASGVSP